MNASAELMRRVLFISYYYPPSGGPGVQRTLKFARYLPAFGWEATVLTVRPENASYPNLDSGMMVEAPSDLQVERTYAWDPYALYARLLGREKTDTVGVAFIGEEQSWKQRLGKWVRANLFLPDARVGWVPFAVRRGARLLKSGGYDVILSTGPPQSAHLIGRALARRTGLPWVADFRDPWTEISYYRELPLTPIARRIDAGLEQSVLEEADHLITVSPSLGKMLGRKSDTPVSIIMNGFDEADFVQDAGPGLEGFTIAYVGNLAAAQNPHVLWEVLRRLRSENRIPHLRLLLVGNIDVAVRKDITDHNLDDALEVIPYVSHGEAVAYMRGASLLLLCINRVPDAACIMTGKVFEYIATGRPVLGIGPVQGDAASVLEEACAGKMFDWEDIVGVAALIEHHYSAWASGEPLCGAEPEDLDRFSRKEQTHRLADLLTGISSPQ